MSETIQPNNLAEAFGDFEKRYRGAYLAAWGGYWNFVASVIRDPRSVPAAYGKLAETSINSYRDAVDASVALTHRLYAGSSAKTAEPAIDASPAPKAGNFGEVMFDGSPGETVSRQFVVANKAAETLDIVFELSEFMTEDGPKIRVEAEVTPPAFSIAPGEEKVVQCRLPISDAFEAGREYRSILRAAGHPGMQVVLVATKLTEPR